MKQLRTLLIAFTFVLILPLFAYAQPVCGSPDASKLSNFTSFFGIYPTTLPTLVVSKVGSDWCYVTKLCPVGVRTATGCASPTANVKTQWKKIPDVTIHEASFFTGSSSAYYENRFCDICPATPVDPTAPGATGNGGGGQDAPGATGNGNQLPTGNGTDVPAAAQGTPTTVSVLGFDKLENPLGPANLTTVSDVIERALGIIIKVSIPFVVLMLIWTGFQFVIAQGNASKITAAKNTLLWVIVGAAILIGCVAIAKAIANSVESVAKIASS